MLSWIVAFVYADASLVKQFIVVADCIALLVIVRMMMMTVMVAVVVVVVVMLIIMYIAVLPCLALQSTSCF